MAKDSIKKVLFIHHTGQISGATRSLSFLLKGFDRAKYELQLINIKDGPGNDLFRNINIEPKILNGTGPFHGSTVVDMNWKIVVKNLLAIIPTIVKGYKAISSINPDIIHLNSTCLFPFAIASKLSKREIPVICHVREPIRSDWYGIPLRLLTKKSIDGLIAISQFDLDSVKLNPKDNIKTKIVYNFVDKNFDKKENVSSTIRDSLDISKDDIVFLYLARFAESNGWRELIHLAKMVIEERKDCHFVLAGAHPGIDIAKYESRNIHILPFQKEINPLLDSADIYVCPFTRPHFARGIIEASAWGLPIVANDIGGVNELVIHNSTGFLYEDEESFLKYAIRLHDDNKMRDEFGKNGIKLAGRNFSYQTNVNETIEFYNNYI